MFEFLDSDSPIRTLADDSALGAGVSGAHSMGYRDALPATDVGELCLSPHNHSNPGAIFYCFLSICPGSALGTRDAVRLDMASPP